MKRPGVQSLLLALALVLLQACAWDTTVPPAKPLEQPVPNSDPLPFFMKGFSAISEWQEPQVGGLAREDKVVYGSGVLISPCHVLTAGHCVDGVSPHWFISGGEAFKIDRAILHPNYKIGTIIFVDLAVLVLDTPCPETPSQLSQERAQPRRGDPLTVVGYGGGIKRKSIAGVFWYYGTLVEDPTVFKMLPLDGTVWFGDSGGAIYNNSGALVGIVSSLGIRRGVWGSHLYENSAVRLDLFSEWVQKTMENNP